MTKSRDNHYVPKWYQKGFLNDSKKLYYLDLTPKPIHLPSGKQKPRNGLQHYFPTQCFSQRDLYTTFFGSYINDDIERKLFGDIDNTGVNAVKAFIGESQSEQHKYFQDFFSYIDCQRIRTPKGLDWVQSHFTNLDQVGLMKEMQAIRSINSTLWTEGVREIVSAKDSQVKFIISDNPVTVYNYACRPNEGKYIYPEEPSIASKASQTIFPLNQNYCLILTHLEYAQDPESQNPIENRTHSQKLRQSYSRFDAFIRSRQLNEEDVIKINLILKRNAKKYIAADKEEWLYPEKYNNDDWSELKSVLLPPQKELFQFSGEMYIGLKGGETLYQDAFGRTAPENKYLNKSIDEVQIGRNDPCGCGSAKKYKNCCRDKPLELRTSWKVLSIRERNLSLYNAIHQILGFDDGKTWDDIRRELNDEQIKRIYQFYASLWPRETDIYDLLPKQDGKLRALYTGLLDPRTISIYALAVTPYFDEVLIQHTFLNSNVINKDFSPIESPSKYKYQFLKDIFFLLHLEPFIKKGVVNLFPDPCCFDYQLHSEMMTMASNRKGSQELGIKEKALLTELNKQDFFRIIMAFPEHVVEQEIRKAMPDLSEDELAKTKAQLKNEQANDPLALLQELTPHNNEQLHMVHMAPNYEMALFIAQVTGSVIVTESELRRSELESAQKSNQVGVSWGKLRDVFYERDFVTHTYYEESYSNCSSQYYQPIRAALSEVNSILTQRHEMTDMKILDIEKNLIRSCYKIQEESNIPSAVIHKIKFQLLIPNGGFVDNNVQRLLIKSNCEHYLNYTPMVIFIEPIA